MLAALILALTALTTSSAPAGHDRASEPADVIKPNVWFKNVPKRCARKAFRLHVFASDETRVDSFDVNFRGGGPFKGGPDYGPEAIWPPAKDVHRWTKIRMPAPAFKRRFKVTVTAIAKDDAGNVGIASRRFRVCAPRR